ncbi:amino acid decarboxylase [Lactobacillus sp. ESL0681]|uniref:prenylated flavin chaperone LpdD n=1 Tax=Lactobacillus sp. ESL0681 TaxID=2983211 RepID=UPI0023F64384|nr:amino acid decarboxylase [Lactobacillus sp. ESL0681]WEV39551.1 amino acid decarboxylase [Lactobacillus sp. ESL0681]
MTKQSFQSTVTALGFSITLEAEFIGPDLAIKIFGGDHPHIGTVCFVDQTGDIQDRPFPSHDNRLHKDGILAKQILTIIKDSLPGLCVVLAGVHVDQISQRQLAMTSEMTQQLGQRLHTWLSQVEVNWSQPKYYGANEQPKKE